jgi:parallel beta-helix repeat protein
MFKHLLYRKDLINRTLTRSLLFTLAQLLACLFVLTQSVRPAEAIEPLRVKSTNPRYFFDSKGNPVYLTGSYLNEYNTLSGSWDFTSHLDLLQQQKQNFTRLGGWVQSPWIYETAGPISFASQPYERTGPGLALDGGLKFDLTQFNQAYFDQLRSRVVEAAQRGIYVSVMLFEGFSTQKKMGRVNPWLGDPFQQVNNINGINGDPNLNGQGEEFFSLAFPSLLRLEEAFVRKVVDTLNDLDNVLYEVSGNDLLGSLRWQYHMIDYVKNYQATKPHQRPVGISQFADRKTTEVLKGPADWVVIPEANSNVSQTNNNKIVIIEQQPSSADSMSAIPLIQLAGDSIASSQNSAISNNVASSTGVTSVSPSSSSTLSTTASLSNLTQKQVATPTINPNGGIYSGTVAVTLQTSTSGASVYYTTDGQSPTESSALYTGKFKVSDSTLVKAKAFKNNFVPSSEASAWFANTVSPVPVDTGLVAHWKFDEGKGTAAADSSGNGNKGALIGRPVWTTGKIGNALSFDGINDNVTVADSNSLDLTSSFTLSAWVNPASTFTDFRSILIKNYKYYIYASVAGYCGDGSPLGGFSETTDRTVCQPSPLPVNTWTHLAVTYNGSTLTLYRDGVAVATSNASGAPSPTTGTLQIGGSQFGEYFKGLIDEVRIHNKALSATEIQTVYQQDSGVASPTVPPVIPGVNQPFTFALSNSGDKSVVAGSSVTNSIATTLISGSSQTISFSASGLPSGATGSFSSTSCTPSCSTVLNISTSGATPAGNFPITVTSTGGGVTKTTAFTLSVTLALTVATPTITPNGGNFSGSVSVAMQTATPGASIYYTMNGSTPTQSSTLYSGAIPLSSSAVVKAMGFKSGLNPSSEASASFTKTGGTTLPMVSITSPAGGSTVSGTTTFNVSASDNVGVSKVEMYIDGTLVDTDFGPYTFDWNTSSYANGSHTLKAMAFNAAGNSSSQSISVTVSNSSVAPPIAQGATYWVSPNGTSANGCVNSATQPSGNANFRTIDDFRFCMRGGDTAMFIPGTYAFSNPDRWDVPAGSPGAYTTIRGSTGNRNDVIIHSFHTYAGYFGSASHHHIEFAHMTFDGQHGPNVRHGPMFKVTDDSFNESNPCYTCGPHHFRFRNVKVDLGRSEALWDISPLDSNTQENCFLMGGPDFELLNSEITRCAYGLYLTAPGALVDGNWFHDNRGYAIHNYNNDHHIVSNGIFRNNMLTGNARLPNGSFSCANAIIIARGSNNQVYNNVIRDSGPGECSGGGIQIQYGAVNTKIYNNTLYNNSAGGIYVGTNSDGTIIRNNIAYSNGGRDFIIDGGTNVTQSNNLFDVNPAFLNAGVGDLRLSSSSPAANAGMDLSSVFTIDYSGTTRPQGLGWDIGAYER